MEKERKIRLMWKWSVRVDGVIGLFWLVWYSITGSVPSIIGIKMTNNWIIQLPFKISRWWDILIGPIWSIILILTFTSKKIRKKHDFMPGLQGELLLGMIVGLLFGLGAGIESGLILGLLIGLMLGLILRLIIRDGYELLPGLVVGLGFALGFGIGYGLTVGLIVGLVIQVAILLTVGLGIGVESLIKILIKVIKKACS